VRGAHAAKSSLRGQENRSEAKMRKVRKQGRKRSSEAVDAKDVELLVRSTQKNLTDMQSLRALRLCSSNPRLILDDGKIKKNKKKITKKYHACRLECQWGYLRVWIVRSPIAFVDFSLVDLIFISRYF
jgi:DNA polymerase III epsilon subunit-like protein